MLFDNVVADKKSSHVMKDPEGVKAQAAPQVVSSLSMDRMSFNML